MAHQDALRIALNERDLARRCEAATLRATSLLFDIFDAMMSAPNARAALDALVQSAPRALPAAEGVLVLQQDATGQVRALASSIEAAQGKPWNAGADDGLLRQAACLPDLRAGKWHRALPAALAPMRALILAPVSQDGDGAMALAFLSRNAGAFSDEDQRLAQRIARIVGQALGSARLARRNEVLTGLITGDTPALTDSEETLDSSFEAVNRVVGRLTQAQALVTRINNDMLRAKSDEIDDAINRALAQTGDFAGSDRTYVFYTSGDDRISNTHEWTAPGIPAMIGILQDLPIDMMEIWRTAFDADQELYIPEVASLPDDDPLKQTLIRQEIISLLVAPLRHGDRLLGFVGYDAVRQKRTFLPGEVFLIRSVANVIAALLVRREVEAGIAQASAALTAERDKMRATLDAMPDLVLELDRDGRMRGYHASASDLLTCAIAGAIDAPLEAAFPPSAAAVLRDVMAAVDRDGRTEGHVIVTGTGAAPRWYEVSASARGGAQPAHVFVLRDITQAREQQRVIDRLGEVARRTTNLVVVTDARGRIDWANPAFEGRSGWPLAEVVGRNPLRLLLSPETDRAALRRVLAALRRGQGARAEVLNRARSGEEYWTDLEIQPLYEDSGAIRGFMAVQVDITVLKNAERRALEERAASMDSSRDGIAITDASGCFVYVNPSQRGMFGLGPDNDIRGMFWADIYAPETANWLRERAMQGLVGSGGWRGEVIGRRRDGQPIEQEVSLTRNPDGGLVWIAHDITQRRRNAAEHARVREQLQLAQRREIIGQLAAGLAHEFNNFLAVIAGSSAMIEDRVRACEQTLADATRISGAAAQAGGLVARLHDLGGRSAHREQTDMRAPLTEATRLLGPGLPRQHRLTLKVPDTPQIAWADPTDVLQVVLNLAINSRDALDDSENEIALELAAAPPKCLPAAPDLGQIVPDRRYLAISVTDTGRGIDEATRARIFEPYFTTKGDAGTGLGLVIISGIVRDNDAALTIDSTPGAGTRITIYWPVNHAPEAQNSRPRTENAAMRLDGIMALVVDDAKDTCHVLTAMLESAGAMAVGSTDPVEALRALQEGPDNWDVLVTDQDMPGLTGAALARQARALRPDLPCVLVSAVPDLSGADRAQFDAVLAKPVTVANLVAALAGALSARGRGR